MFRPVALFIGLRYTRAKRDHHFISLISIISMLGLALGVVVLITVLSVLNGFDREIKKQIFGMISPITISSFDGGISNWQELASSVKTMPDITAVAPLINGQGLLTTASQTQPAIISGILPDAEKGISTLADKMTAGKLSSLSKGHYNMVLGYELAKSLGVDVGDILTVVIPQASASSTTMTPRFQKFTITGIFHSGGGRMGFDNRFAFIHLADAQTLFRMGDSVSALRLNITDLYAAPAIAAAIQNELSGNARVGNWTEQLGDFFENIRLTKTMMFFIFILIIAVAVFNLISTMVMAVKNKHADIAILRTLGATPGMILGVFVVQGAAIGCGGILLGILGGVALSKNIQAISTWIQTTFHIELISANMYFVNYLPAQLQWHDVWIISATALVLSLLATLYPAWNASRVAPVEALRSE